MTDKALAGTRKPHVLVYVVLIVGSIVMLTPFVWQILTSIRSYPDSIAIPPKIFAPLVLGNFGEVFDSLPFAAQFANSVIMTVGRTAGQVLLCTAAGFAFARLRFPGRNIIFGVFLAVLMLPSQLFLLSQYQIIQGLGLINTIPALILPGMFSAFGTFLMRQSFLQLPEDLFSAARIDGAGPIQMFFRIGMPLAGNGMLALGILTAIWSWNDLLWPLVVNTDPGKMPLSSGLATLQGQHLTDYPVLMAGSLMASLPMIILFVIFQKNMIQGIAAGSVKG